jgi:hypothetical protein
LLENLKEINTKYVIYCGAHIWENKAKIFAVSSRRFLEATNVKNQYHNNG